MADAARTRARERRQDDQHLAPSYLFQGSNIHDFGRYADVDLAIAADARGDAAAAHRGDPPRDHAGAKAVARRRAARASRAAHKRAHAIGARAGALRMGRQPRQRPAHDRGARRADARTTTGRSSRATSSPATGSGGCLNFDKPYRYNGDCGGFGIGYDTPAIGRRRARATRSSAACRSASSATAI